MPSDPGRDEYAAAWLVTRRDSKASPPSRAEGQGVQRDATLRPRTPSPLKAVFAADADHERWFEGMTCAARQSGGLSGEAVGAGPVGLRTA